MYEKLMGTVEAELMRELDSLEYYLESIKNDHQFYDGTEDLNDYDKLFWDNYGQF